MPSAPSSSKKANAGPGYYDLIKEAVIALKERTGSSRHAIDKYVASKKGEGYSRSRLNIALKKGVEAGKLVMVKGSYKLTAEEKKAPKAKAPATKKKASGDKKKTVKKTAAKKSDKPAKAVASKPKKASATAGSAKPKAASKPAKKAAPAIKKVAKSTKKVSAKKPTTTKKKVVKKSAAKKVVAKKAE